MLGVPYGRVFDSGIAVELHHRSGALEKFCSGRASCCTAISHPASPPTMASELQSESSGQGGSLTGRHQPNMPRAVREGGGEREWHATAQRTRVPSRL